MITVPLLLLIVIIFEVNVRVINKIRTLKFEKLKNENIISADEFEEFIKKGRKLAVIDNFVIDYGQYHIYHPGGRFALTKTVGRDISKFFYGGY